MHRPLKPINSQKVTQAREVRYFMLSAGAGGYLHDAIESFQGGGKYASSVFLVPYCTSGIYELPNGIEYRVLCVRNIISSQTIG